jgi:hypothetical protein
VFTVNTPFDEDSGIGVGQVSLRDAINEADSTGDTVKFDPAIMNGEIIDLLFSLGEIEIRDITLTIDASMLSQGLTIEAGQQGFRILRAYSRAVAARSAVIAN